MHGLHLSPIEQPRGIYHGIDIAKPWSPVLDREIPGEIACNGLDIRKGADESINAANRPDRCVARCQQFGDDMPANETGCSQDEDAQG
jgi:hypothetical protein